jgi:hypothetical protein
MQNGNRLISQRFANVPSEGRQLHHPFRIEQGLDGMSELLNEPSRLISVSSASRLLVNSQHVAAASVAMANRAAFLPEKLPRSWARDFVTQLDHLRHVATDPAQRQKE